MSGTRLRQFSLDLGCTLDDFDELLAGDGAVLDQDMHQALREEQGGLSVRMPPLA